MEIKRVAAVSGGLIVVGGIAGALVAALAIVGTTLAFLLMEGGIDGAELVNVLRGFQLFNVLTIGAIIGAVYGAVLGPLAAWLLMRHVPLGIAVGGTMLGTLAGGVAGLALNTHLFTLPLAGFAFAALVIRTTVPRPERVRVRGE